MAQYDYSKYLDENKKMNKKLKWVIIIVLILLFVLFIGSRIKKSAELKAEKASGGTCGSAKNYKRNSTNTD